MQMAPPPTAKSLRPLSGIAPLLLGLAVVVPSHPQGPETTVLPPKAAAQERKGDQRKQAVEEVRVGRCL